MVGSAPSWPTSWRTPSTRTPTRHYCDPSLVVAVLGASPEPLLRDMATFGLLFESLCVRDLRAWEIDDGAASLLELANKVDASVIGAPAFCAVITPDGYAYRREDGVLVLPVTCLAP